MKKIILALVATALLLVGCSSEDANNKNVVPKLVVDKTLNNLTFNDQFGKSHTVSPDTYTLVFAFAKAPAHICNDFFATQKDSYLKDHHTEFIADVSAAPSLIRKLFVMPGLKKLKHPVLVIEDKKIAAPYRKGMDVEKVVVVHLLHNKISDIQDVNSSQALQKIIEDDSPMSIVAPLVNEVMDKVLN